MPYPSEQPATKPAVEPTPHSEAQTTPSVPESSSSPSPRLPHERDESGDSQTSEPREVMKQAQKDVERGLVDTDRGPMVDKLYEEKIRTDETPTRGSPG